jgi:hypothetical protein
MHLTNGILFGTKVVCSGKKPWVLRKILKHIYAHGILRIFNTILYKTKFQNPQIFRRTHGLFPEQSTLLYR